MGTKITLILWCRSICLMKFWEGKWGCCTLTREIIISVMCSEILPKDVVIKCTAVSVKVLINEFSVHPNTYSGRVFCCYCRNHKWSFLFRIKLWTWTFSKYCEIGWIWCYYASECIYYNSSVTLLGKAFWYVFIVNLNTKRLYVLSANEERKISFHN